jgi:acyl dehydratase
MAAVLGNQPVSKRLAYEDVNVGERLGELKVDITRTIIVAGAIASRDYQDVHHDPELARKRGSPDIFMNILTTNGFVGRFVTDWSGPAGVLESISIRLGAPNYPGDTMVMSGEVVAKHGVSERNPGRGVVEVAVRGKNSIGDHVVGSVRVALPLGQAAGSSGEGELAVADRAQGHENPHESEVHS